MGGKSSSQTSQKTTTEQTDRRIGATDSAIVIAPERESPIDITLTDALAFEAVDKAGALVQSTFDRALLTADRAVSTAEKAAESAGKASESHSGKTITDALLMAGLAYGAYRVLVR